MLEQNEILNGRNKVLVFRRFKDRNEKDATKIVFQTSHTFSYARSGDRIVTKDGVVLRRGDLETSVEVNALQAVEDEASQMLKMAMIQDERLEVWEITIEESLRDDDGKYPAVYAQGFLESWDESSDADGDPEVSGTLNVELEPQFDYATLTEEQREAAQYAFRDTVVENDEGETP